MFKHLPKKIDLQKKQTIINFSPVTFVQIENVSLDNLIIHEDADLLVINKPFGVVVNRAQTVKNQTVQDWLASLLKKQGLIDEKGFFCGENKADSHSQAGRTGQKSWQVLLPEDFSAEWGSPEEIFQQRSGIVHRLDKDTSGVLLLAKNPGSLVNLLAQFKKKQIKKTYCCLVHGKFRLKQGLINAPIFRARKDRKKYAVDVKGRTALTEYRVIEEFTSDGLKNWLEEQERILKKINKKKQSAVAEPMSLKITQNDSLKILNSQFFLNHQQLKFFKKKLKTYEQGFSLVECYPKTGRTHQIRVHMAHLQHPLVGDQVYAGKNRIKLDALWCQRQFLHAQALVFKHPRTSQQKRFLADLSTDLSLILKMLK